MKVLVVDDDPSILRLLKRILSQFHCDVIQAENGVEALAAIETSRPDLVLLDTLMPVMDGLVTLATIRASPEHAELPVVSISGIADRAMVLKLVNLGISDYLLKPINVEAAHKRLNRVIASLPARQRRVVDSAEAKESGTHHPRLLVVDPDPNFRAFVEPLLSSRFEVVTAAAGGEALKQFVQTPAKIVLLYHQLPLLGASQLATALRRPSQQPGAERPAIFVLNETGVLRPDDGGVFDGALKRSFVPELFMASFGGVVASGRSPAQRLATVVRGELVTELISAAEQAVGVMCGLEISAQAEAAPADMPSEVAAQVELALSPGDRLLVVGMQGSRAHVEELGGRILGGPATLEEGSADALGELVNAVAGRLRTSLDGRGLATEQLQPRIAIPAPPFVLDDISQVHAVRAGDGAVLWLTMAVRECEPRAA